MNILIFVVTMLMLLSLMTYTRLETYRSSQVFQVVFKHYMEKDERGYINTEAIKLYNRLKVSTKNGKSNGKVDASPRIGIGLLVDKKLRESKQKEWEQTQALLKNLMTTLYAKQPFFRQMEQERPSFLNDLIASITQAAEALPPDRQPKTTTDLANLRLADPQLDKLFYKMLHGAFYKEVFAEKEEESEAPILRSQEIAAETDLNQADAKLVEEGTTEFQSQKGYFSLLDFVTLSSSPKIRVYLAPKEVLQSIFHDPATVEAILAERKQLYKQAVGGAETKSLETAFKNQFDRLKDPAISEDGLNYSVTKTNPKYYE